MVDFGPDILDTEVPEVEPLDVDISSEPQHELAMALSSGAVKSSSPVVFDFSLQSRVEVILNAIINDLVYGENPKSRVEQILLYILGEVNELPKPHSRVEELLIDLALELESTDISPKSRVEQILLVLLNQPYEFPITRSRVEELLVQLQTHVSEVTGPLPLTISTDGTALIDYRIYGNTEQTGTPTPENPIMPEGVGERTENLWIGELEQGSFDIQTGTERDTTERIRSDYIHIQNSDNYTITLTGAKGVVVYVYDANKSYLYEESSTDWQKCPFTRKIEANRYVRFAFAKSASGNYDDITPSDVSNIMLVKGSTAPDQYIPNGYKLPILSNSTVTDVYLGEVETTRRIKKLVLTGEENWKKRTYSNPKHTFDYAVHSVIINGLCSHYGCYPSSSFDKIDGICLSNTTSIIVTDLRFTTATDFKSYLSAQYAAGTPVTVWYVLAEPETGTVNEPLMKIGDYADTISMEQAGVSIPTIAGTTVIDYDGTPKPSQMYAKYNKS